MIEKNNIFEDKENNLSAQLIINNHNNNYHYKFNYNKYKCHMICFFVWIITIGIMIGYYYLK